MFSQGAEVFNAMRIFSDTGGYYTDNQFDDVLRRWRQPGDVTDVPRASYNGVPARERSPAASSRMAPYWRMQDLTLGYRLPERWAGSLGFASARFYGSVRNLFTITDYSGYTPDVNSNGASNNATGIASVGTVSSIGLGTDFYAYPLAADVHLRPPGLLVAATSPHGSFAMTIRIALAFALVLSLGGCNSILDQNPIDQLPDADAITNAEGARAALIGAYSVLEDDSYYGGDYVFFGDLATNNAANFSTFQSYADADANQFGRTTARRTPSGPYSTTESTEPTSFWNASPP